jgi:hypothetical protein
MKRVSLVVAALAALACAATASAAPPVLASPGASPFLACTADDAAAQQAAGSVLYPNAEVEPRADVNPTDPLNIVGFYQQDRWSDGGARGLVASVSRDGGASWHRVVMPGISKCSGGAYDRVSDPWLSFAPNGDLYAISLAFDAFDTQNAILVSKSTSTTKGESWSDPIAVAADDTNGLDKQSITADPYMPGFVYAVWDRFLSPPGINASDQGKIHAQSYIQQAFFSRTTNGGASWEPPRVLYNPGTHAGTIGSIINVLPNATHDLVDGFIQFADHKAKIRGVQIAVVRSTDHGATWSKNAIIVSPVDPVFSNTGPTDPDNGLPIRGGELPDFTVDPRTGTLYAVWEDDPFIAGIGAILFSQSTDGGFTWSLPVKINQTPTTIPTGNQTAFTPTVNVAPNGTVAVTYYDLRNNTPAPGLPTDYWMVRCAAACTSSSSWSETHVAGPFDEEQAPFARGFFLGDYEGMVTLGNTFGAFFVQAGTSANPTDAFFSTVP